MTASELYQQIAEGYQVQGKYQERDRFLVLALDAAHTAGQNSLAERLRTRLLELNPNHLIKPYPSVAAALQAQNFVTYLSQLRKNFPVSKAQSLLQELAVSQPTKPKRTMLAEPAFPMADPAEDRNAPTWSQMNLDIRSRQQEQPVVRSLEPIPPPLPHTIPLQPINDPLANVPSPVNNPVPFTFEAPKQHVSSMRRPEIVPAPSRINTDVIESPSGQWIGNILFVVMVLASLAVLSYIFVLPYYPEVAKMVKL